MRDEPVWVRYARDWGWRAYAIPVLAVITIWVLVDVFASPTTEADNSAATVSSSPETSTPRSGPNPANAEPVQVPPTELPPGAPYTEQGEGTYRVIGNPGMTAGEGTERVIRYVIEVENGVSTCLLYTSPSPRD